MDFSVYTPHRNMRTLYSTKQGQNRPFQRLESHVPSRTAPEIEFFLTYTDPAKDTQREVTAVSHVTASFAATHTSHVGPVALAAHTPALLAGWEGQAASRAAHLFAAVHPDVARTKYYTVADAKDPHGRIVRFCKSRTACPFTGHPHNGNRTDVFVTREVNGAVSFKYYCHGCRHAEPMVEIRSESGDPSLGHGRDGAWVFKASHPTGDTFVQIGGVLLVPNLNLPFAMSGATALLLHAFLCAEGVNNAATQLMVALDMSPRNGSKRVAQRISDDDAASHMASVALPLRALLTRLVAAMAHTEADDDDRRRVVLRAVAEAAEALDGVHGLSDDHRLSLAACLWAR